MELTLHHGETEEVQLLDSNELGHAAEDILTCGLRLQQNTEDRCYRTELQA